MFHTQAIMHRYGSFRITLFETQAAIFWKIRKIHRKAPATESFWSEVVGCIAFQNYSLNLLHSMMTLTSQFLNTSSKSTGQTRAFTHRDHPFIEYANFFENLTLPPDTHTYECVSGGKKCYIFGKLRVHTNWMIL